MFTTNNIIQVLAEGIEVRNRRGDQDDVWKIITSSFDKMLIVDETNTPPRVMMVEVKEVM
jgi:hypothetical protein